ncbi:MAG TPA: tetratricopeptide repeat protein [Thermodesulfobacteriota bacterium]|nr:tetratricopeptide repeat protein [Deltaproteobacteria bacterium]HNR12033.1 tetratricopeptide repeat protein [Thermodesulfobacteriota bacterium]HNU72750.1 tetratricopeptide repeat protein [Thermodesulfobacteriota bacterium]HOC37942.1 tetratricopeptide repeat protein [Thermodesulfobacteriota bacterium]
MFRDSALRVIIAMTAVGVVVIFFQQALARGSAEYFFSSGVVAFSQKDFEKALAEFTEASRLDPENAQIQHYRGMTYLHLGEYDRAVDALKTAAELDPAIKEIHYDLGVAYFRAGMYAQALARFRAGQAAEPDRAMVYFYQGYTHYMLGEYYAAEPLFRKAEEMDPSLVQSCRFFRAMSLARSGKKTEAEEQFQAAIDADPTSELAEAAAALRSDSAAHPSGNKRWNITGSLSTQYDDNVSLQPDDLSTEVEISDEEDVRAVVYLVGDYHVKESADWSLVTRYSLYQSIHASLHDFDLTQNEINVGLERALKNAWLPAITGLDVNYSHNLLNGRRYLELTHLRTMLGVNLTPKNYLQMQYRLQAKDFHYSLDASDYSVDSADADRDAVNHLVGWNHFWFHGSNSRCYLRWGFLYDRDRANGDDWEYSGYRFLVGYFSPLWKKVNLTVDGEYYYQDYDAVDSLGGKERSDREITWVLSLDRNIGKHLNVALQYLGRDHDSNIDEYAYDRNVTMITLTALY